VALCSYASAAIKNDIGLDGKLKSAIFSEQNDGALPIDLGR
jgi:hypothetical protein